LKSSKPLIVQPRQEIATYPERAFERPVAFSDVVAEMPPSEIEPDVLTSGLAATFSARIDNPFFRLPARQDERTGAIPAAFAVYAPYYIGTGYTPEQIAKDIAQQGALFLKRLDAEHGYDGYVGRLMAVLRGGHISHRGLQALEDRNIMFDVHDFMALITMRLHHLAPVVVVGGRLYSPAEAYRTDTHETVDPYAQTIAYEAAPGGLNQRFELPEYIRSDPSKLVALGWDFFDSIALRRGAEFAALAAEKVGDPLVRSALSEHYVPPDVRRRMYMAAR
jgi:hypothetical protein